MSTKSTFFRILIQSLVFVLSFDAKATCTYPSSWPDSSAWAALNRTLQGNLIRAHPAAAPCHDPHYDESLCSTAKANWSDDFFRSDQPGGYQDTYWENGDVLRYVDKPRNLTCQQGFVLPFVAAVRNVQDVQAVNFATKRKLSTRVKGASHDFLGRSSGHGALGIQTIRLKGIVFAYKFMPEGCNSRSQPAVTVAAGEHWYDVNKAADAHGGNSYSVGAAGGWILGGGHSSLSPQYGLGVDNALQFTIVTPDGRLRTANECTDKDLFWALRGGGVGFGVVMSVTYKTHPTAYQGFLKTYLALQPAMSDAHISGYTSPSPTSTLGYFLVHNSGGITAANNTLKALWDYTSSVNGSVGMIATAIPSYLSLFSGVPNDEAGKASYFGSRLLPRNVFESAAQTESLATLLGSVQGAGIIMHLVAGGKVSQVSDNETAVHPSWRKALQHVVLVTGWASDTPLAVRDF